MKNKKKSVLTWLFHTHFFLTLGALFLYLAMGYVFGWSVLYQDFATKMEVSAEAVSVSLIVEAPEVGEEAVGVTTDGEDSDDDSDSDSNKKKKKKKDKALALAPAGGIITPTAPAPPGLGPLIPLGQTPSYAESSRVPTVVNVLGWFMLISLLLLLILMTLTAWEYGLYKRAHIIITEKILRKKGFIH